MASVATNRVNGVLVAAAKEAIDGRVCTNGSVTVSSLAICQIATFGRRPRPVCVLHRARRPDRHVEATSRALAMYGRTKRSVRAL